MQTALFSSNPKKATLSIKSGKIQRVYFGHEFCHRLLPTEEEALEFIRSCSNAGVPFTLATPILPPGGMRHFKKLVKLLDRESPKDQEILTGDWGALWFLHKKYPRRFQIVAGRLLSRQRTGPRIELLKHTSPNQYQSARRCHLDVEDFIIGMKKMGVVRFELDWPIQGIDREFLENLRRHVSLSIHTPWVYVSTTLRCPMIESGQCRCQGVIHRMRNKAFPVDLYNIGNTVFYRTTEIEKAVQTKCFDRVVVDERYLFAGIS